MSGTTASLLELLEDRLAELREFGASPQLIDELYETLVEIRAALRPLAEVHEARKTLE